MSLRELEADSIRAFVESCSDLFDGRRVLDYGCGRSPYRDVIEGAGGEYVGYDRSDFPANVSGADVGDMRRVGFDVILSTQVIQYVPQPRAWLLRLRSWAPILLITGPTNWPVVEAEDLWRFTVNGARRILEDTGFTVERLETRGTCAGDYVPLGWAAVAHA